ncbi:hypothetical protein [Stenotrophomonas sp. 24(2023)]|uniref:hypothetical protein n=1 Tax=Stenotrophomonas sp. 24(2023) TaxID=3068324 RepID=UPI0027DF5CF7|nr:hypothetical protein [Stenotrophomonas sp. 24(2023)]WMJ68947.1 hypothetical protein Q9R17_17465 [Stenotrophomonas sp. 24(2023)]
MHFRNRPLASIALLACACVIGLTCLSRSSAQPAAMKPSITYLHLLRHTPFFTALSTPQLRWVIDHSHEWEATAGTTITSSAHRAGDDGYWILLDGGWELRYHDQVVRSGHADPGKWFNRDQLSGEDFALVANTHSYVMHISSADMDTMLAQGFAFQAHLAAGTALYDHLHATSP